MKIFLKNSTTFFVRLIIFLFLIIFSILSSPKQVSAATCGCNPPPDTHGWTDNMCFHPHDTAGCPQTFAGGYCNPNGDKSYEDADWVRGYYEYKDQCGSTNLTPTRPAPTITGGVRPTQGTGGTPGTTQPTQPPQSSGGTTDLDKCVGYSVAKLKENIIKTTNSIELAEEVERRIREACTGNTSGGNQSLSSTPVPTGSTNITPGTYPGDGYPKTVAELLDPDHIWPDNFVKYAQPCLKNIDIYKQASAYKGYNIPWQILAAIHAKEAGCDSNKSPVSGTAHFNPPEVEPFFVNCSTGSTEEHAPVPFGNGCRFKDLYHALLYESVILMGKLPRGTYAQFPDSFPLLVHALAGYNGWGNTQCGKIAAYTHCPPAFKGEDHTYPMNFVKWQHYVVYCTNQGETCQSYCTRTGKCTVPLKNQTPGVVGIIGALANIAK